MGLKLALLPGDGAGSAGTTEALNVLESVSERFGYIFNSSEDLIGGVAIDTLDEALGYATSFMYDCRICQGGIGGGIVPNVPRPNRRGGLYGV